jgi:hypothetical protein
MAKAKKSGIKIKKKRQGSLRAHTKTKKGAKIPLSKLKHIAKNGTPMRRKQAQFAINARCWNKGKKR